MDFNTLVDLPIKRYKGVDIFQSFSQQMHLWINLTSLSDKLRKYPSEISLREYCAAIWNYAPSGPTNMTPLQDSSHVSLSYTAKICDVF